MMLIRKIYKTKFQRVLPYKETCVVCYNNKATHTCIPCAHEVLCDTCASDYINYFSICPICRMDLRVISKMK